MTLKKAAVSRNEFCACGCGKKLAGAGRSGYSAGHYPRTSAIKAKQSNSKLGRKMGTHTEEWKQAMSRRMAGPGNPRFGKRWTNEERAEIAARLAALPKTRTWNENISRSKKGKLPYPTALEVLSRYNQSGDGHSCWQGGLSFQPYPPTFNDQFKAMIRERDSGRCALCGDGGSDVHHINYVKDDTNPQNCVTLCKVCHGKTNHNRPYWQALLERHMRAAERLLDKRT